MSRIGYAHYLPRIAVLRVGRSWSRWKRNHSKGEIVSAGLAGPYWVEQRSPGYYLPHAAVLAAGLAGATISKAFKINRK